MSNKKIKKTDLSITLLLILGIVVVVNFFAYQIFHRWDLTEGRVYSISRTSRDTVGALDDIVNIKAYFSSNLPSQLYSLKQEVTDILDEYESYSKGNIRVKFIDPSDDEQTRRDLYMLGIPQLTFDVYEKDQRQLVNGYMGIAISYGDNTEVIPAIKRNTSDLEYQLTTAIKKVTSSKIATIGVLTSNGTSDTKNKISTAYQALQKLYSVENVDLSTATKIPDNVDTLLVVGPTEKFSEDQLRAIDAFLARGKSLLVMLDGVTIGQGLVASANNTGLDGLLANYGIKFNRDLVLDKQSGVASFNQGYITFSTNYPYWPEVQSDGFNKDNSAVANLEDVVFPWASSLDLDQSKLGGNAQGSILVHTTDSAWHVTGNFNVNPQELPSPASPKEYDLAVMVSGQLPRAYAATSSAEDRASAPADSRIVVVGDSDFVSDNFAQGNPDNLTMFQNLVDILSLDEDLINIRSKTVTSRPIQKLSDGGKAAVRYFNVFGLTIAVIIFGLLRYYMRRRSRFVDEL